MNPYHVLGVSSRASDKEISRKYKTLAKKYHPDLNPGNAEAARRMGDINLAYQQIKTMRQQECERQSDPGPYRRASDSHRKPHPKSGISPVAVILGAVVMFFLVRLLLSILFGGYGGYYYVNSGYNSTPDDHYYYVIPGQGAYPYIP